MAVRVLVLVSLLCFGVVVHARKAVPMNTFKLDLNVPPEERWKHIIETYHSSVPLIVDYFNSLIPKEIIPIIEFVMRDLDKYFGDLGKEMTSISEYTGIDLGMVVGLNIALELRRLGGGIPNITETHSSTDQYVFGCTSIVAQDKAGNVFHGRNMDWNLPDNLRNTTIQIDYYRGNQLLFQGITTVGYVGILTGVSPYGFSVSINERDLGGNIIVNAIDAFIKHSAWCPSHLLRQVMEKCTSYSEAHKVLSDTPLVAPVYYIMAGSKSNEGAILSRDRNANPHEKLLNVSSSLPNSWYLMETNYDYWDKAPAKDDRRSYAHKYLQTLGQDNAASLSGIYSVLSQWPVWNRFTTYTALMNPAKYEIHGYDVYT